MRRKNQKRTLSRLLENISFVRLEKTERKEEPGWGNGFMEAKRGKSIMVN